VFRRKALSTALLTLDDLRRYAVARTLFAPTTLARAIEQLGFVQADPIRAPARAQDLILRLRVRNYRAGDLERRYARLGIEEDFFVNYGFLPRSVQVLMHPRAPRTRWSPTRRKRAQAILEFLQQHGALHPRKIDAHFAHGKVANYWGGSSNATTHLLDAMHYRSMLRVVKRVNGTRIYAAHSYPARSMPHAEGNPPLDALIDVIAKTYGPLPVRSFHRLVRLLGIGAPQWRDELTPALRRAKARLGHAKVADIDWYWPAGEDPLSFRAPSDSVVRLLAPFDPIVWDRERFETFWRWAYRFEAYTPPAKRKLGYYALPLLWQDRIIGWGNLRVENEKLVAAFGYLAGKAPKDGTFKRALGEELERMRLFLSLTTSGAARR
jgi:uncharacterized protein YcaQ